MGKLGTTQQSAVMPAPGSRVRRPSPSYDGTESGTVLPYGWTDGDGNWLCGDQFPVKWDGRPAHTLETLLTVVVWD